MKVCEQYKSNKQQIYVYIYILRTNIYKKSWKSQQKHRKQNKRTTKKPTTEGEKNSTKAQQTKPNTKMFVW